MTNGSTPVSPSAPWNRSPLPEPSPSAPPPTASRATPPGTAGGSPIDLHEFLHDRRALEERALPPRTHELALSLAQELVEGTGAEPRECGARVVTDPDTLAESD